MITLGFPGGTVVKNLPVNAGDARDVGSIPESGRSAGLEMAIHSGILAWKIPWTEEPGSLVGYSPWGRKESDRLKRRCKPPPPNILFIVNFFFFQEEAAGMVLS